MLEQLRLRGQSRNPITTPSIDFSTVFDDHVESVYRYAMAWAGDPALAQDLTSQTFLSAFENRAQFRGEGDVRAWLFTIARNKLKDHLRRERIRPQIALEELRDTASEETPQTGTHRRYTRERIAAAIHALPRDRAEAVTLRLFAELDTADIARILRKSEPNIRKLISRALHDLRAKLEDLRHDTA